jgi:CMP-N,N'-diacetyllegionaminic acid synthase
MKILITICARGGSKGIPGKNIRDLNGKPLIAYTIKCAQEFARKYDAKVALSTDSAEIIAVAESLDLHTEYKRPDNLATDSAGKIGAIQDIMEFEESRGGSKFDYIIDLDVTSPMRTLEDLERAFDLIKENPEALNIFSVSPAARNPYFNMVEETASGFVRVVKGDSNIKSRQNAPAVYDMNASFYIFRRLFFENGHQVSTTEKSLAYVMPHICFDLDEPHDFTIMEIMLRENLLNFNF